MSSQNQSINGSDKFRIRLVDASGISETLNFSFRYQALNEYDTTVSIRHELIKGSIIKKPKFVKLKWEIDFTEWLEKNDAKLINKLKNAEMDGYKIFLTPHIDLPGRYFQVNIVEDERKLGKHYGRYTPNKDYVITFENTNTINRHNWLDPDDIPVITHVCDQSIKFIV